MRTSKMLLVAAATLGSIAVVSSASANSFVICTPVGVAEVHGDSSGRTNRVHVQCATATNDNGASIIYFAMPVTDAAAANRFVSIATAAMTLGRQVNVEYNPGQNTAPGGTDFGCYSGNCRYVFSTSLL